MEKKVDVILRILYNEIERMVRKYWGSNSHLRITKDFYQEKVDLLLSEAEKQLRQSIAREEQCNIIKIIPDFEGRIKIIIESINDLECVLKVFKHTLGGS